MKKVMLALALAGAMFASACTSKTEYGECVGAFDDKDPKLVYKVSVWNVFLGVFFFEMIVPPIIVIANETHCPVGIKEGVK